MNITLFKEMMAIAFIVVTIIDISGFINSLKYLIGKVLGIHNYLEIRLKPFDCSFCMTFWLELGWTLHYGFSLDLLAITLFFSILTPIIKDLIYLVLDLLNGIINQLNRLTEILNR